MEGHVMNAVVGSVKERNEALEEMVNQVRLKLLGAEIYDWTEQTATTRS